jgi:hypothetical protein
VEEAIAYNNSVNKFIAVLGYVRYILKTGKLDNSEFLGASLV